MNLIRMVIVNFGLFIFLLLGIEICLSLVFFASNHIQNESLESKPFGHNVTPEVAGFLKESVNFRNYPYKAFAGWKAPDIQGDFLNIRDGKRITKQPKKVSISNTIHFFGGSTMWGHSVSDKNTIPSLVAKSLSVRSVNYGEQAYNSRQSLNRLLDESGQIKEGDVVVFYDGVNDVYHNCRSHNSANGHAREYFFRDLLISERLLKLRETKFLILNIIKNSSSFKLMAGVRLLNRAENQENTINWLNSCTDNQRAEAVANFIVTNWRVAEEYLASRNVKFVCALQPNPYTLGREIHYRFDQYRDQTKAVYPKIATKAKGLNCFEDMSKSLTADYYVDSCCHLNEIGNQEVSNVIVNSLKLKLMAD